MTSKAAALWLAAIAGCSPIEFDSGIGSDASVQPGSDGSSPDGSSSPDGVVLSPQLDAFGLTMVYPTKAGKSVWVMAADPLDDSRAPTEYSNSPNFAANDDGSFKVTKSQVRWNVYQANGFHEDTLVLDQGELAKRGYMQDTMDWKNVEVTAYYRVLHYTSSTTNGPAHIEHVMGGARQTNDSDVVNGFPMTCEASSYHANLYPPTGRAKYEKDLRHTDGYSTNNPQDTNATTPFADEHDWVGYKTVKYVLPDGLSVKLESYIDRDGTNSWQKIFEFTDDGTWGPTQGMIGSGCGGGEYTVITWGGPIVGLRWDNIDDMDVKWATVREIDPTATPAL
ncbi:MAG: hypothetical protein AB7O24_28455 [Kofleriaceae bacterium]